MHSKIHIHTVYLLGAVCGDKIGPRSLILMVTAQSQVYYEAYMGGPKTNWINFF